MAEARAVPAVLPHDAPAGTHLVAQGFDPVLVQPVLSAAGLGGHGHPLHLPVQDADDVLEGGRLPLQGLTPAQELRGRGEPRAQHADLPAAPLALGRGPGLHDSQQHGQVLAEPLALVLPLLLALHLRPDGEAHPHARAQPGPSPQPRPGQGCRGQWQARAPARDSAASSASRVSSATAGVSRVSELRRPPFPPTRWRPLRRTGTAPRGQAPRGLEGTAPLPSPDSAATRLLTLQGGRRSGRHSRKAEVATANVGGRGPRSGEWTPRRLDGDPRRPRGVLGQAQGLLCTPHRRKPAGAASGAPRPEARPAPHLWLVHSGLWEAAALCQGAREPGSQLRAGATCMGSPRQREQTD